MQKRTLALSVASILAATSFGALAEMPTIYGTMDLSVTDSDTGYTVVNTSNDVGTVLENNNSNIGLKGTFDLNSALKLVYKAEFGVNGTDNDADTFSSRNTYMGLAGGFGEVVFGRNDTAFKKSEGGVDLFGNHNADFANVMPGSDRVADGITYSLPKMGMLTGVATYILEDDNEGATSDDGNNFAATIGYGDKKLKKANYYVGVGYVDGIKDLTAYRLIGQLKIADLSLGAIYQDSEKTSNTEVDAKGYLLSAKYPVGNFIVKGQFGYDDGGMGKFATQHAKTKDADGNKLPGTIDETTVWTVGADYPLSKAAYVYGYYSNYTGDFVEGGDINDDVFTVGLNYKF
ncbi:porin [Ferrimonas aestuarii]|nr:porin [Ferrimonas aestuarii]